MSNLTQELNNEIADVVELVRRSVVQIHNGGHGAGAGTIWHSEVLIVTNAHVADKGPLRVALADGRSLPARVLASDSSIDLAALSVEASDLPTIDLGESSRVKPGQLVLAMGHPWGVVGAVAAGVVIGVGAHWPEMPSSQRDFVVVSLKLRPGNSGGPLVDVHGRLVGINSMITGPEVGMAVPVHVAKVFLREAIGAQSAAG